MTYATNEDVLARMPEVEIVARTAFGEASNQGERGIQAVINVIMNRASRPRWWGKSPATVCLKPLQFSCWNGNDPNRKRLLNVSPFNSNFLLCQQLASKALAGELEDVTGGADHYHTLTVRPRWRDPSKKTEIIGDHIFYRLEK